MAGPVAVLNLGGVANVTYVDGDALLAFDTGPASALLDDWVRARTGAAFDADGALAASGRVDAAALAALGSHPFFALPPPKSLDRNAFSLAAVAGLSTADGAATLAAFTVDSVARARAHLKRAPRRWLVGGGGRHNRTLMAGLAAALGVPVEPVEAVGWDGDALEAQAFGFLAVRSVLGLPLSLPETTGRAGRDRCEGRGAARAWRGVGLSKGAHVVEQTRGQRTTRGVPARSVHPRLGVTSLDERLPLSYQSSGAFTPSAPS